MLTMIAPTVIGRRPYRFALAAGPVMIKPNIIALINKEGSPLLDISELTFRGAHGYATGDIVTIEGSTEYHIIYYDKGFKLRSFSGVRKSLPPLEKIKKVADIYSWKERHNVPCDTYGVFHEPVFKCDNISFKLQKVLGVVDSEVVLWMQGAPHIPLSRVVLANEVSE